jgi:hypothetical protein
MDLAGTQVFDSRLSHVLLEKNKASQESASIERRLLRRPWFGVINLDLACRQSLFLLLLGGFQLRTQLVDLFLA